MSFTYLTSKYINRANKLQFKFKDNLIFGQTINHKVQNKRVKLMA